MHGAIHILDMHGTGTKHIDHNSRKSSRRSGVGEFACRRKRVLLTVAEFLELCY